MLYLIYDHEPTFPIVQVFQRRVTSLSGDVNLASPSPQLQGQKIAPSPLIPFYPLRSTNILHELLQFISQVSSPNHAEYLFKTWAFFHLRVWHDLHLFQMILHQELMLKCTISLLLHHSPAQRQSLQVQPRKDFQNFLCTLYQKVCIRSFQTDQNITPLYILEIPKLFSS